MGGLLRNNPSDGVPSPDLGGLLGTRWWGSTAVDRSHVLGSRSGHGAGVEHLDRNARATPVAPGFFASRTRASQAAIFLGFLLGGIALQWTSTNDRVLNAFAALFAVAGLCRLGSVWMLSRHSEPTPIPEKMREIPWRQMRRHLAGCSGGQLLIYLVVVQAAVQMSGPYFTPFMLEKLRFSYGAYSRSFPWLTWPRLSRCLPGGG